MCCHCIFMPLSMIIHIVFHVFQAIFMSDSTGKKDCKEIRDVIGLNPYQNTTTQYSKWIKVKNKDGQN